MTATTSRGMYLLRLGGVGLLFLGLMVLLLYAFQNRVIFFPFALQAPPPLPTVPGRVFEHVRFQAADGTSLYGIWMGTGGPDPASAATGTARPVVLFSHGNGGNLQHVLHTVEALATLPVDLFAYDYRGYGLSSGSPTVPGVIQDGQAALRYLTEDRRIPLDRIILFGFSLGSGITMAVAEPHLDKIAGIVLEAGIASLKAKARSVFWVFGPLALTADFPNTTILEKYQGPLLVVHSRQDEVNGFANGELLFAACPSAKKTFLPLSGFGHNSPFYQDPTYLPAWREFLARLP